MKTLSILGDSYSTYEGWVPSDYHFWYDDHGNECENDMQCVEQTWWMQLYKELGLTLLDNCSFSGSTVCNTGYDATDASTTSFIHRMKRELGEFRKNEQKPDIILVFGGTNDFWAGSPVGTIQYENWNEQNLKEFAPALAYMFDYLLTWNPESRIFSIVNDEITGPCREILDTVAKHYGIEQILLHDIEKDNGHPNVNGMREIKNQVKDALLHVLK